MMEFLVGGPVLWIILLILVIAALAYSQRERLSNLRR